MDFESIPIKSGVYKITNIENGYFYIGCSKNFQERCKQHISASRMKEPKSAFHKEVKNVGIEKFNFEVLEIIEDVSVLFERELYWQKELLPYYNTKIGGKFQERWKHLFVPNTKRKLEEKTFLCMNCGTNYNVTHDVKDSFQQILDIAFKIHSCGISITDSKYLKEREEKQKLKSK